MSSQPEVTLVMPVWQPRTDWLRAAVASALAQTGCDLELTVVDDGSTAPVAGLLDDIADARLRVIRIEHAGASAARNAGTAEATGRFIRYVDADDILTPDGTRSLLDHCDEHTIAHGTTVVCDEDLTPVRTIGSDIVGDATIACLLAQFDVRHVSMLIPARVARSAGPWDTELSVGEDWDFVLRCVELAPVAAVSDVVTYYRRHAASATRRSSARSNARTGQRRVIEKYVERHPDARHSAVGRAAWTAHHDAWARQAIAEGAAGDFLRDAAALTRIAPVASFGVWRSAIGHGLRSVTSRARRAADVA